MPLLVIHFTFTVLSSESWRISTFDNSLGVGKLPRKGWDWFELAVCFLFFITELQDGRGSSGGGREMRGQPRSPSHFHTQVEEAWEAKDIDEVSPQSEVQRGCPPLKGWRVKGKPCPNISTDQPPEVVISVPDARSTEGGCGRISPNSTFFASTFLYLAPPVQSHLGSFRYHQLFVWDFSKTDPFALCEETVCSAGFFKPHHKCIFIFSKEQTVFKDFSTLFMSQWKLLITNGSYLFTKASLWGSLWEATVSS